MISYKWYLSPDQPFNKEELFKLQYCLHAAGILLDLSWDKGSPVMSISVPEGLMEKADEQPPADVPSVLSAEDRPAERKGSGRCRKRGRPTAAVKNDLTLARIHHMRFTAAVKNDLTLARIHHMRFMNVPVETIAKEIGVSRRTFYRRWNQIAQLNLDPETPFSKWI